MKVSIFGDRCLPTEAVGLGLLSEFEGSSDV